MIKFQTLKKLLYNFCCQISETLIVQLICSQILFLLFKSTLAKVTLLLWVSL